MLTAFGAIAVTFMMVMYALEHRHRRYVLGFACGCVLSSAYGFLAGSVAFVEVPYQDMQVQNFHGGDVRPGGQWFRTPVMP